MSKTYLPYDPDQQLLLPAAPQEWLPPEHLAYFISDVVDQLDLSDITARYEQERRGGPPYHPRMMVKVLLYGYCVGVASSRRIAQRLHEDIAFRVLAANNTPDFRTVSDFRKDHLEALGELFLQVLELCQQAGLVKLGHVALDGTKVRANASKHKVMSYGRRAEQAESEGRNHPRVPDDKAQRNFTDPDSRIMPGPGGRDFQQSYNCQAVVDSEHQVIVAARATDQPSDKGQAVSMIEQATLNVGTIPKEVSADAGYYSAKEVEELYALRMETVEPVFGQIKQGRGFRQGGRQRRHWEQQGDAPDHGQWDFQATIRRCLTAPRQNCCRRAFPADRHRQLVNPQTGC